MTTRQNHIRSVLPAIWLGGIFMACAMIAIATTRANEGIALLWPGNAIVAAVLIRMRRVNWPAITLAILLAGVSSNMIAGNFSWLMSLSLTGVNMLEIAAMVLAFRVVMPLPYPRLTILQAVYMTLIMGILITGAAALLGGTVLHALVDAPLWSTAAQWWASDALAACLLAPPIILYSRDNLQRLLRLEHVWANALRLPLCIGSTYLAIRYLQFPFVVIALVPMVAAYQMGAFGTSILSVCNVLTILVLWVLDIRPIGIEKMAEASFANLPFAALIAIAMPPIAVGLGNDARRLISRALRASEQRFRESMEGSPLGMIMLDRNGQWSFTNEALQNMLGYSRQELSEMGIESLAHPDDLPDIWEHWGKLVSQQIASYKTTRRFQHRNGNWIWVDCAVSLARDADGLPLHFVAQVESLEERRRAEASLAAERELLRVTLASIGDAVITADPQGRVTYMNNAAVSMLGRPCAAVTGKQLEEVLNLAHPESGANAPSLIDHCRLEMNSVRRTEPCALMRPDGSVRFITDVVTPILDAGRQLTGFVTVLHDVSVSLQHTRDLRHRADHDPLTNLQNRLAFERSLHQAFSESRSHGTPATLIALDLDRFKAVNDSSGHAAGDAVLRHVAAVLRRSVRPADCVGRLGGDEFILLLRNCDLAHSQEVSQRLLQALNPLQTSWEGTIHTTGASLGLAQCSPTFEDPTEWTRAADAACYEAKRGGRGILRSWHCAGGADARIGATG
jgi:diguanylate cyclase